MSPVPGPPRPQCQDPHVPSARNPVSRHFPVLVCAGLVGCRWLGSHIPLSPQFILPHSRGSSHGQSRITRSTYPHMSYARMMPDSFRLWQQLEAEAGTSLYR